MQKVVIGIVPTFIENKESLYDDYYKFIGLYSKKIIQNDMIPIGLLLDEEEISQDTLELCDGFIIPGGNKVRKFVYEIIYYAIKTNKPLIGICMGAEAIDIFSCIYDRLTIEKNWNLEEAIQIYLDLKKENNGTLLQKLEDNNIHDHDFFTYDDYHNTLHEIKIEKNSIAYSIFNQDKLMVPSMHSFNFKHVGKEFIISAIASDDVAEIIEYNKKNYFIIGFHFHPELMDTNIFKRLKEECLKRKG